MCIRDRDVETKPTQTEFFVRLKVRTVSGACSSRKPNRFGKQVRALERAPDPGTRVSRFGPDGGSPYSAMPPMSSSRYLPANEREPLQMSPLPSEPWKEVPIDFWGPINTGEYLLVVIIMQTLTVG